MFGPAGAARTSAQALGTLTQHLAWWVGAAVGPGLGLLLFQFAQRSLCRERGAKRTWAGMPSNATRNNFSLALHPAMGVDLVDFMDCRIVVGPEVWSGQGLSPSQEAALRVSLFWY